VKIHLHPDRIDHYDLFLKIKSLPKFRFDGETADVPDEYASLLGIGTAKE
jgi:hypothetical protein